MRTTAVPQCNRDGRVVWMTDAARDRLGQAASEAGSLAAAPDGLSVLIRFTPVLEWHDRILVRATVGHETAAGSSPQTCALLRLESNLLERTGRLQAAQSRLAARAGRGGSGSGAKLVEQLELERQRLGRELHTGVGQSLAAIKVNLELIETYLSEPTVPVRSALDHISDLNGAALQQVRTVSHRLHPPDWQRLSLAGALTQLWEISGIPQRFEATLKVDPLDPEPPHIDRVMFYRAAQEAMSNLVRHSNATCVDISLRRVGGHFILTVADNGGGFDPAQLTAGLPKPGAGIGLRSIREQVEGLGGGFAIRSGPGGTTLEVSLPVRCEDQ